MLTKRFDEAFALAQELHGAQRRKNTTRPYIGHLMSVCAIVLQYGGDEDEAIAALLHDGPEDAGGRPTLERIRAQFGERVARIVEGCTDTFRKKKPKWKPRKKRYVAHVRRARADVQLVSAADKLSNVREILGDYRQHGEAVWERFTGKRDGTLWYYRSLVRAFRHAQRKANPQQIRKLSRTARRKQTSLTQLVDELARAVAELHSLAAVHPNAPDS